MSGLEVIGIAASVLQIADVAARLSQRLFEFSRRTRHADKSIKFMSKDIKSTGVVLRQLGIELSKDEACEICSRTAIDKTDELINDCLEVFLELDESLDTEVSSEGVIWNWNRKLKFLFREPQFELLRSNLDRLRSSLMLMLGTLTFAGQIKSHESLQVQAQQRKLIQSLVDDLRSNKEDFEHMQSLLRQGISDSDRDREIISNNAPIFDRTSLDKHDGGMIAMPESAHLISISAQDTAEASALRYIHQTKTRAPLDEWSHLLEHSALVRNIVFETNDRKYRLDHVLRGRITKPIHHTHWLQWNHYRKLVGDQRLLQTLNDFHSELAEYWKSQIRNEKSAVHQTRPTDEFALSSPPLPKRERLEVHQRRRSSPSFAMSPSPDRYFEFDHITEVTGDRARDTDRVAHLQARDEAERRRAPERQIQSEVGRTALRKSVLVMDRGAEVLRYAQEEESRRRRENGLPYREERDWRHRVPRRDAPDVIPAAEITRPRRRLTMEHINDEPVPRKRRDSDVSAEEPDELDEVDTLVLQWTQLDSHQLINLKRQALFT